MIAHENEFAKSTHGSGRKDVNIEVVNRLGSGDCGRLPHYRSGVFHIHHDTSAASTLLHHHILDWNGMPLSQIQLKDTYDTAKYISPLYGCRFELRSGVNCLYRDIAKYCVTSIPANTAELKHGL